MNAATVMMGTSHPFIFMLDRESLVNRRLRYLGEVGASESSEVGALNNYQLYQGTWLSEFSIV